LAPDLFSSFFIVVFLFSFFSYTLPLLLVLLCSTTGGDEVNGVAVETWSLKEKKSTTFYKEQRRSRAMENVSRSLKITIFPDDKN
jgi:hypothetical protein